MTDQSRMVKPAAPIEGVLRAKPGKASQADHEQIEIDRSAFFRNPGQVRLFREYAAGIQQVAQTSAQQAILEGLFENPFSDNVCHQINAEAAARLDLSRFEVDNEAAKAFLTTFALRVGLDDLSGDTHYNALRDGDYALTLGWDAEAGQVTLLREPWWDGQTGVFVVYDAQGNPLYAIKEWTSLEGYTRRTVWYEDRIERYAHDGTTWLPFALPSDNKPGGGRNWPAPWVKADGAPLHIPLVHFANVSRGNGRSGFSVYGTSELDGGVLGFQDQLNDLQMDISAAARLTGYQMIYATGAPLPKGEDGQNVPFVIAPGSVMHSTEADAKFGTLAAGDLSQLISTYNAKLRSVSRMTRTPLHAITGGDWPSGEALLRSELPAVNKARTQIKRFAPDWVEVAHRAVEIANVFGKAGLDEDAIVSAIFAKPDQRDPLSIAAMVQTIAPYVSAEERLRLLGYAPGDIEKILGEMDKDAADGRVLPTAAPDVKVSAKVPTQQG